MKEVRKADDLNELTLTARRIMEEEIQARFFGGRPSNIRLVQIWMDE